MAIPLVAGCSELKKYSRRAPDAASVGVLTGPPWTVSLDTGTLTPGDHFIAARATTPQGHVGVSDTVRIRVNNLAPVVAIDFPPTGHRLATRGTLIVSGSAVDGVEGTIPLDRISWRSSLDGVIGAGPYFRRSGLSVGMHTLTAEAVNAWGTTATASIQVEVMALPTYTFCIRIPSDQIPSNHIQGLALSILLRLFWESCG